MTKEQESIHLETMQHIEESDYEFSLSVLTGKKIKDVVGYPSIGFGADTPVFCLTEIIFEDGASIGVEGEHDFPYLSTWEDIPNLDFSVLAIFDR